MSPPAPACCPVCRAAFRETVECSRCGADLRMVMHLAADAWLKRQAARQAIRGGQYAQARLMAAEAQRLQATAPGRRLAILTECLDTGPSDCR